MFLNFGDRERTCVSTVSHIPCIPIFIICESQCIFNGQNGEGHCWSVHSFDFNVFLLPDQLPNKPQRVECILLFTSIAEVEEAYSCLSNIISARRMKQANKEFDLGSPTSDFVMIVFTLKHMLTPTNVRSQHSGLA